MSAPSGEDDRTVVATGPTLPGTGGRTSGGADAGDDTHALPIGTRLNEFELTQRIGEGGFSIVYLAWDHSLERRVAVKEYMPGALASRFGETQIRPRSERHRETFEAGLKSFVNEAKLLARFDHPALVKVYRFWEANGTAYLVMPLYEGATLKQHVRALPEPPNEAWLLALLGPLTAALQVMHNESCFHRDIAPDNVMMLTDGGKPLLLDFGAARRVIGDMTQALTVILKPGFAPVEQYAEIPDLKQGAWTDVYALAATVYWAVTGKTPPASVGRMLSDAYVPLAQSAAGRYSARFLHAIDRALAVHPDARTQSVAAFRRDLGIDPGGDPVADVDLGMGVDSDATVIRPVQHTPRTRDRSVAPSAIPPIAPVASPAAETRAQPAAARRVEPATSAAADQAPSKRSVVPIAIALLAAVAVAGGGYAWWSTKAQAPREAATAAAPAAQPQQSATPTTSAPAETKPAAAAAPAPIDSVVAPVDPAVSDKRAAELLDPPLQPPTAPPPEGVAAPRPSAGKSTKEVANSEQPKAASKYTAQEKVQERAQERPQERPQEKAAKSEGRKPEAVAKAPPAASSHAAECAQIYQRLSLGETRPDLIERAKSLKCQ